MCYGIIEFWVSVFFIYYFFDFGFNIMKIIYFCISKYGIMEELIYK